MAIRRDFPVVIGPLAVALASAMPLSVAATAALAWGGGDGQPGVIAPLSGEAALARASQLLQDGKPILARAVILRAFQQDEGAVQLGDQNRITPSASREQAMNLLAEANRKIGMLEPNEASLQKAEVAIEEGDLRSAERHAQAVAKNASSTQDQAARAQKLLRDAESRRAELAPGIPALLDQARTDFEDGRYASAKSALLAIDRSGVALSDDQRQLLDRYQMKLIELASTNPDLFSGTARLGMMQPGVVRRQDQPASTPPSFQPEPPPPVYQPVPAIEPLPPQPTPQPYVDPVQQVMQTELRSLMEQADSAFNQSRYQEASGKYGRLLSEFNAYLTPEQRSHVQNRINESRLIISGGHAPTGEQPIGPLIRQQTEAFFDNEMSQANIALQSGNPSAARDHVAQAQLALNRNRQYFPESEYEARLRTLADMNARIAKTEQEIAERRIDQQTREVAAAAKNAEELQRTERERKIVEFIDRARAYQAELRYEEALQTVDQLLFLDPNNPTGLLLRDIIGDIIIYRTNVRTYENKQRAYATNSMQNLEAMIPPPNIVNYHDDWAGISIRRGEPEQFAETPENRRVLAELNAKRIPSVAFNDNSLDSVVQFIQQISNVNLDVDWASLENANIRRESTVSLSLSNVTVKTLLDRVMEKISGSDRLSRADWAISDGVVTVASEEKIRKNTALVIYDVRDLLIEVPDYRDIPRIDLQQALQSSQGGGSGQSPFREEGQDQQQELRDRAERMDDLISIITSNIDFEGWQENGGDTGRLQPLVNSGNLIITNTPKNHRAIAGLLSKLREIRAMQINVETRFLLVNQDFFEQIGFDIDVYLNTNNNQVRVARGADRSIQGGDFFSNGRLQRTVTGQVAPNAATTAPDGTQLTQAFVNPRSWSPIGFTQDSLGLATGLAPSTDWSDAILGAAPALGIAGQFLDDIQVDFLITATQADRRSIQLTAPRLTFTNGQMANIYVATQVAFVSDLEPVVGDSAVGFDPTVAVATEGVTLLVEGTVSADRRYVTMNVDAGVARIDGFAQQSVSAVAGGQLVSSAAVQSFIQLPQVTVTRVRTTVTVPDQGTILMGGQRLVTEYEIETGVPVLSKIPVINRFFTNRIESREEQTLLILIKPTILIQNEEEEKFYPGLLDSLRTGMGG